MRRLEGGRLEGAGSPGSRLEGTGCRLRLAEDLGRPLGAHQRPHLYRQLHAGQGGEGRPNCSAPGRSGGRQRSGLG